MLRMAGNTGILSVKILEDMFIPMLLNCRKMAKFKNIHAQVVKFSLSGSSFLVTKMVEICDRNGEVGYASLLFRQVSVPNIFLYNAMIRAYTRNQTYLLVIDLYKQMLRQPIFPDKFTYPFVIRSCGEILSYSLGKQLHGHVFKFGICTNIVTENSLLDMYIKCDCYVDAHELFEKMSERDVISWNSLICGHIKMGRMKRARAVFEEMPNKSIVSWTAMISGYTRIGCYEDALDIFRRMQMVGVKPDWISLIAVLPACTQLGALELGKWIHFYAEKNGFLRKTCVSNALIEMYAKSGNVDQACQLFEKMPEKDVITWSTMIGGLSNHGKASKAIQLFHEMQRAKVEPNEITFVGLLSACTHAGFLNDGLTYFDSMRNDYKIEPRIEHYGCLVDLLGRSGYLDRALELIRSMPMKPDSAIWGSLLSSCRSKGNLEMAVVAMENLLELEPDDTGNYVLLSNIYAALGRWEGVSRMRTLIKSKSIKRTPGSSSIEVNNVVQEFVSGDYTKPFFKEIYRMLELLALPQSKVDDTVEVMPDDRSQYLW